MRKTFNSESIAYTFKNLKLYNRHLSYQLILPNVTSKKADNLIIGVIRSFSDKSPYTTHLHISGNAGNSFFIHRHFLQYATLM